MTGVTRRGVSGVFGEVVLTLLAIGGAICLVLVALSFLFNITLIMFKTGSMSPTITTGSVAMVREIPASAIEVGDVVTVDREDALPVTHRVTSVTPGPTDAQRVITMRGDANAADDVAPYTVTTVRIVMGSVPALAYVIVWFSNPLVLGAVTVGAAGLVTWAFWPREPNSPRKRARARAGRHAVGVAGTVAVLALGLTLVPAHSAQAAEQVIQGEFLTLTSITDPGMASMAPGTTVHWQVGVASAPPSPGVITMALWGSGNAGLALTVEVRACAVRWAATTCAAQEWQVQHTAPLLVDAVERELLTMPSAEQRWLLFTVTMPASALPASGEPVTQRLHVSGSGDSIVIGPGHIASTGVDAQAPMQLALVAVLAGLAFALVARRIRSMRSRP
jgi:signal peptidase